MPRRSGPRAIDILKASAIVRAEGTHRHRMVKRWVPLLVSQDVSRYTTKCKDCGAGVDVEASRSKSLIVGPAVEAKCPAAKIKK